METNFPRFDVNYHNGRYFDINPGKFEKIKKDNLEKYVFTSDLPSDVKIANIIIHVSKGYPSNAFSNY